jgi:hypothetical protein
MIVIQDALLNASPCVPLAHQTHLLPGVYCADEWWLLDTLVLDAQYRSDAEFLFLVRSWHVVSNGTHKGSMQLVNSAQHRNVFVRADEAFVQASNGLHTLGTWIFDRGYFESSDRVLYPLFGEPWNHLGNLLSYGGGATFGSAYTVSPFETDQASGGHSTHLIVSLWDRSSSSSSRSTWEAYKDAFYVCFVVAGLLLILCLASILHVLCGRCCNNGFNMLTNELPSLSLDNMSEISLPSLKHMGER